MCTGTGDLALAYDKAAKGKVPIVGADFCHQMLERAIVKIERKNASDRIRFLEADAQKLPFPNDHFQIATVAFGLRNVTDTDRGIAEMVRVTQPGGQVAILEFSKPRGWLFKRLFAFYFRWILPIVGQVVSGSRSSAYKYLPESVQEFDDGDALAARLRRHGLEDVRWHSLTFGVASLYVGTKRRSASVAPL
jgi:demethylmenaquinone methyltransferase/2-methoxy-6-polyprenyl-1,4-benzoquinol methylase